MSARWVLSTIAAGVLLGCAEEDDFSVVSALAPPFYVAAIEADPWQIPDGATTSFRILTQGTEQPEGAPFTWELCAFTEGPNGAYRCSTRDDGLSASLATGDHTDPTWTRDLPPEEMLALCLDQDRYSRDTLALPVDCRQGLPAVLRVEVQLGARTAVGVKTILLAPGNAPAHPPAIGNLLVAGVELEPGHTLPQNLDLGNADLDDLTLEPHRDGWTWYASYGPVRDDALVLPSDIACGQRGHLAVVRTDGIGLAFEVIPTRLLFQGCGVTVEHCGLPIDSDDDGRVGCEDPDCDGLLECTEYLCDDGLDNEADGRVDCEDPDCQHQPACAELACSDAYDNDGDGLTDCDDPDCVSDGGECEREHGHHCMDGRDNDDDTLVDCEDPDCRDLTICDDHEVCSDGLDNNSDGRVDCDDPDCAMSDFCVPLRCGDGIPHSTILQRSPWFYDVHGVARQLCAEDQDGYREVEEHFASLCPAGYRLFQAHIGYASTTPAVTVPRECLDTDASCEPTLCVYYLDAVQCSQVVEQCDSGDLNGTFRSACLEDCTPAVCGDGVLSLGEECDDGNRSPDDLCSPSCEHLFCGNGTLDDGEACDDGNFVDGDGCSSCVVDICGDGRVAWGIGEACDGGDFCDASCQRAPVCAAGVVWSWGGYPSAEGIAALSREGLAVLGVGESLEQTGFGYPVIFLPGASAEELAVVEDYVRSGGIAVFTAAAAGSPAVREWFGIRGCEGASEPYAQAVRLDEIILDGPAGAADVGALYETRPVEATCALDTEDGVLVRYANHDVLLAERTLEAATGRAYFWSMELGDDGLHTHPQAWMMIRNLLSYGCR